MRQALLRNFQKTDIVLSGHSDIDIISAMCNLMARGAIVSMLCVIFILPAMLMLCDKLICATTWGMRGIGKRPAASAQS